MSRLNQDRVQALQPKRVEYALEQLKRRGYQVTQRDDNSLVITTKQGTILYFPYSGWHSGKGIKDGRGFSRLVEKLGAMNG